MTTTISPGRAWPPERTIDVVGIGNALVDVLSHEDDDFVAAQGIVKGSMTLIDADRAAELYSAMSAATEVSGGSAANTVVGVASFGGTAAYIGKVRDDQLGAIFSHDIRALGVEYVVPAGDDGRPHRPVPHPRHARRPADHEHVPRRVERPHAPRTSTRP